MNDLIIGFVVVVGYAAILAVLVRIFTKGRECPFCSHELPDGFSYCPLCDIEWDRKEVDD